MTARDYPVTFAYGDVDGYYYTNRNPHRGNDRPTPNGTEIRIGDTVIGWTGNTGLTSGPHLHTQAGIDADCQQTVEPSPYEFQTGTVVDTGTGPQWGNYIIIKTGGHYICYAHLSDINVNIGQVIGATSMITKDQENVLSIATTGGYPGKGYDYRFTGKEANQTNLDAFVNFWNSQSQVKPLQQGVKDLTAENEKLKARVAELESNTGEFELAQVYVKKSK